MAKELHIRIDSHIGVLEDSYGYLYVGFTALELEWRLMELPNPNKLVLHLGTEGGDVWEGLKIYSRLIELREKGTKIEVIIESICYSMGTVLAMTASPGLLKARETSMWCPHKPMISPNGALNADELRKKADELDSHESALTSAYVNRTGKSLAEVQTELREDKIISAQEAKDKGWIDEIITTPSLITNTKATALKPMAFVRPNNQQNDTEMITPEQENSIVDKVVNAVKGMFSANKETETPPAPPVTPEPVTPPVEPVTPPVTEQIIDPTAAELETLRAENATLQAQLAELANKDIEIQNLRTQLTAARRVVPGGGDNSPAPEQDFKGTGGAANEKTAAFNNAAERFKQKYNKK